MSRFIKYASNLLDGVDSMAKDSLTDQDIAAAAAERRRRRRQLKLGENDNQRGGGGMVEPSEGDLSGDSSYSEPPGRRAGAGAAAGASGRYGRDARPQRRHDRGGGGSGFEEGGGTADEGTGHGSETRRADVRDTYGGGNGDEDIRHRPLSSTASATVGVTTGAVDYPARPDTPASTPMVAAAAATVTAATAAVGTVPAESSSKAARLAETTAATAAPHYPSTRPTLGSVHNDPVDASSGTEGAEVAASAWSAGPQRSVPPRHHHLRETVGIAGGAPGKEDGSVWSDKDTISSAAPSPLRQGQGNAGGTVDDEAGATRNPRRPPPLQPSLLAETTATSAGVEGGGEDAAQEATAASADEANAGARSNLGLSPATTPLAQQQQQQQPQQQQQQQQQQRQDYSAGFAGTRAVDTRASGSPPSGRDRAGGSAGPGGSDSGGSGAAGVAGSRAAAFSTVASSASGYTGDTSPRGATAPAAASGSGGGGSRERVGLGSLLRMGGGNAGRGRGGGRNEDEDDAEALRAEAADLREEVEELSLELEDAEDRLRGQEAELKTAAERLKRQKAAALERQGEMQAEMVEFRALQLEEKKVFLANLEGMERALKEKEREADEARSALSALEAFAMEREDAAARLMHEKEELLEELKGAHSGQNRSAEEVREALTRAEAEAEEVEARHRAWMRQAQARQTELEATSAQLAEALAEARGKSPAVAEGPQRGSQATGAWKVQASDREARAFRDELDSCQASLEVEQEHSRSLKQEVNALRHDLDAARATEALVQRQKQEHAKMAADSFAKAARLEQQLQQEKSAARRLSASTPTPAGPESQIQTLSSKLLDKQARLEESVRERATLSAKLKEASTRAFRAEQELRELRGESLEGGGDGAAGEGMRSRRRQDRLTGGGGRSSTTGSWSRLSPIAKHEKIASAVDVLDRQTLQAVVFLRNSSVARASFLGYLLLLHLWAFMVLSFHSSNMTPNITHPADLSGNDNHAG